MLDFETRVSSEEFPEWFPLMGGGIIEENDDWAAELPQQLPQKQTDLFLCDVVKEEQVMQTQMVPLGAQGDSGNHRNFIAAPLAMMMNGSLPLGRPGLDHQGS